MTQTISSSVSDFGRSLASASRVLDVGCGARPYQSFFAHCEYVGVDVEVSGRPAEHKQPNAFFNGRDLPFEDASFDALLCTEVLEHATDPIFLGREMRRVLKPGGSILITVPFIWGEHETPYDFRRFSSFGMLRFLDEVGLELVSSGKLTCGIDAIDTLVRSEIVNYDRHARPPSASAIGALMQQVAARVARATWALQLRLWRRLYRFERIYIDNLIVARRRLDG